MWDAYLRVTQSPEVAVQLLGTRVHEALHARVGHAAHWVAHAAGCRRRGGGMVGRGGAALVELLLESRHLLGLLLDVRPVLFDLCKSNQLQLIVKAMYILGRLSQLREKLGP